MHDDDRQQHDTNFNDQAVTRALVWIGAAGLGAVLAVMLVRALAPRPPADPTAERIQDLIDEANRLLKSLDSKHSG